MFVIHRIESLDDGTAQPSLDPPAFLHASLDFVNAAITFTRVVISSVDHHDVSRHTFEKIYRKVSNLRLRNGHDDRSEEHTSELQSRLHLVCRLLLEKKKTNNNV